jgi:tetratricopeptide (TPR) repeat protein
MLQIQNGPEQYFEGGCIFAEFLAYCLSDDLTGVRQTTEFIEKTARRFDGWVPIMHYGKSEYHRIRGDYCNALFEAEQTLALTRPGRHVIWICAASAQIKNLFELGRLQEARELGYQRLEAAREQNYTFMLHHLGLPLALVEAKLDHGDIAIQLAEEAIDRWKALGVTGMTLGWAYETRARVAIYTDDPKSFRTYSKLCGEQYRVGQNTTLTAKHEKLIRDARHAYIGLSREARQAMDLASSLSKSGDLFSNIQEHLAACKTHGERVDEALDLIVKRSGAKNGYLYLVEEGELRLASKTASLPPPDNVIQSMRENFQRCIEERSESDATETVTESNVWRSDKSDFATVESVLLSTNIRGKVVPLGSVILCLSDLGQYRPDSQFYEAIARCLYQSEHPESESTGKAFPGSQSRYVTEALLGEGGTASVYRARDRESGRLVALKRVQAEPYSPTHTARERAAAIARKKKADEILQREYQTLKSLVHPRIVEVYDFGVDEQGAFYTMELLQGADLRQLAPLEWRKACLLLRDVASALALLHSRRLLHRDVSPRNVRLATDGRIKLVDFGTMTTMGVVKDTVGTPPFMPPEAIYRRPLDQKSDLYSLGALAYWLLTRRHAFPVRRPGELRDAWRTRPPVPSEEVKALATLEPIPELLDRLVMSLLSLDPLARPSSAAEVMERINAIADLPVDEQLGVPKAYLTTPTLVGRHDALLLVRKRVVRSLRGQGGAILVEGTEGAGCSRFLDACVMEGKVAGMVVLRASANDSRSGPYAVAQTLLRQLFQEMPDVAVEEMKTFRNMLSVVVPDLFFVEGETGQTATPSGERDVIAMQSPACPRHLRPRVQATLVEYVRAIGRRRSLMIAVDDVHRIDEPSAAFLALLSHEISESRVVLTLTAERGSSSKSSNSLGLIREEGVVIEMQNLSLSQTENLLGSVFGEVPNLRILADKLYSVSEGNPGAVMDLAQYLADQGVVRYQAGAWTLPSDLNAGDMPSSFKETLRARIRKLDTEALRLAQAMALDFDQRLLFEQCVILTEHRDPARVAKNVDALIAAGIVSTDGKRYGLNPRRWVSVLLGDVTEEDKRQLHLRLAELSESRDNDRYLLARHLLYAGEGKRALTVFISYIEKARERFGVDKDALFEFISEPPREWEETLLGLLQICDTLGATRFQRYLIQHTFAILGAARVIPDKTHLLAVVRQLYHDCGLDLHEQLTACEGAQERLVKALDLAQRRYETGSDAETVLSPAFAIADFPGVLLAVLSMLATSLDHGLAESVPAVAPLNLISAAFGLFDKNISNSRHTLAGRFERARQGYLEVLERTTERPDGMYMSDVLVSSINLGTKYAVATIEASWGLELALTRANELETSPSFKVNAWQLRTLYYLRQGDVQKVGRCKKQLELLRIQNSVPYFEGTQLLSEMYAYSFSDDLIGIKRTIDDIETMANRFDEWIPVLHLARGEYHRIRGDHENAIKSLEQSLELVTVGRHLAWPYLAGAYVNALFEAGRLKESQTAGRKFIGDAEAGELGLSCNYIRVPLARTEASLGEYELAVRHAQSAIDSWKALGTTGINLGLAYESRARVACFMNDQEGFWINATLCAEQYRKGRNSALKAKYERLIRNAHEAGIEPLAQENKPTEDDGPVIAQDNASGIGEKTLPRQ